MSSDAQAVLDFWFEELTPAQWFKKDAELDRTISQRFGALHAQTARCECYAWRQTPQGRLAEIIVLDQFSRNMFRNDAKSFTQDAKALQVAKDALAKVKSTLIS